MLHAERLSFLLSLSVSHFVSVLVCLSLSHCLLKWKIPSFLGLLDRDDSVWESLNMLYVEHVLDRKHIHTCRGRGGSEEGGEIFLPFCADASSQTSHGISSLELSNRKVIKTSASTSVMHF